MAHALIPPDTTRCQTEKRDATFMSFGGDCKKLTRCTNTPTVIAKEKTPGEDGIRGSMSLCDTCRTTFLLQMGSDFATLTPITKVGRRLRADGRAG